MSAPLSDPDQDRIRLEAQEVFAALHGVSYNEVIKLLKCGQAVGAAVRASDRDFATRGQLINIRPSLIWPGGETWRHD